MVIAAIKHSSLCCQAGGAVLLNQFTSVLNVRSREDLFVQVLAFTKHLGFDTFNATVVVDRGGSDSEFSWVHNPPSDYRAHCEDPRAARRDPVCQHCRRSSRPIVWNQRSYI